MKKVAGVLIVLVLSYFSISQMFISGFFPMHDDTQPSRVFEMAKALSDGQFPVRWVADLGYGYGYPIFNFYAPLAYYFGAQFFLVGFDAITATKIMMAFGFVMAGVSMYFLAREFWGEYGGILSALLYVYAPYHALNLYVRGDVAEFWAYGFIPLVFLGMYRLYKSKIKDQRSKKESSEFRIQNSEWFWVSITAIAYAAVILSHNLTALMITPFVLFVLIFLSVLIYKKQKKLIALSYLPFALFLGILLSAFYWLPVPFEMGYTNVLSQIGGKADYRQHFVCLPQLWNSPWGFGGSTMDCFDGMSYRIGKLHIVLSAIVFAFGVIGLTRKKQSDKNVAILIAGILLVIGIWLTTPFAKPVWDLASFMSFFQYPWRFLLVVSLFSSFLGGAVVWIAEKTVKDNRLVPVALLVLFIGGIFFLYGKLFQPQTILPKTEKDYIAEEALKWDISKISDEYLPKNFDKPELASQIIKAPVQLIDSQAGTTEILQDKTGYKKVGISVDGEKPIRIHIAPFPAWKFFVDGRQVQAKRDTRGYIVSISGGTHTVEAVYKQTVVQVIANILSLTGIVVIILAIMRTRLSNQSR